MHAKGPRSAGRPNAALLSLISAFFEPLGGLQHRRKLQRFVNERSPRQDSDTSEKAPALPEPLQNACAQTLDRDDVSVLPDHETTEGRGGMAGLKSGQRVAGSSTVEARGVLCAVGSSVPHGQKQRAVLIVDVGPAKLAAHRAVETIAPDKPKAGHALTLKSGHSGEADQRALARRKDRRHPLRRSLWSIWVTLKSTPHIARRRPRSDQKSAIRL